MSPELLHPQEFGFEQSRPTKRSDCYALGMVVLEVLSDEAPFARDNSFIVMRKVMEGERPERPERAWFSDNLWRTLEKCWSPQPKDRPAVEAVLECLDQVSKTWQPLPPIVDDVETDSDESVFATSHRMFVHFVPNSLLTTRKDASEFTPDPSMSNTPVGISTPYDEIEPELEVEPTVVSPPRVRFLVTPST